MSAGIAERRWPAAAQMLMLVVVLALSAAVPALAATAVRAVPCPSASPLGLSRDCQAADAGRAARTSEYVKPPLGLPRCTPEDRAHFRLLWFSVTQRGRDARHLRPGKRFAVSFYVKEPDVDVSLFTTPGRMQFGPKHMSGGYKTITTPHGLRARRYTLQLSVYSKSENQTVCQHKRLRVQIRRAR
jgi:hypothetical protein